jgi:ribosomal-protein-alanine N-acetyltransferase
MKVVGITERLILRQLELYDIHDLEEIWGDSEVMLFCGGALRGHQRLLRSVQYYETIDAIGGISVYAVILRETEEMIGVCGLNAMETPGIYELIYHFKRKYWGKGYATEACKTVICKVQKMKKTNNFVKLIASVAPDNEKSDRVLIKCGFRRVEDIWFEDTHRYEPSYEYYV